MMFLFKENLLVFSAISLACFVEPRRLPCQIISKNEKLRANLKAISKLKCKLLSKYGDDVQEHRTTFYRKLTFDLKIKRGKNNLVLIKRAKDNRSSYSCFRVLFPKSSRKVLKEYTATLSCSERYMKTEGSVHIYRQRKHGHDVKYGRPPRLVTAFSYHFEDIHEPCTTYQPRVHIKKINGGVNISSCYKTFHRMEFGLYNMKTKQMELPPVEPLNRCWVFFSNLTHGEFKGTVQIMSCSDCEDFALTGEPCETIRYRSSTFTFGAKPTPEATLMTDTEIPTGETYTKYIHVSIGIVASLITLLLLFFLDRLCRGCQDKPRLPDDELPLIQKDLSSKSKKNKILVIYDADHSLHVGAVKSFCQLLSCFGKKIVTSDQIQKHGNMTSKSIISDGFGTVIIILSQGSFKKCENFSHAALNQIHDPQPARNCLDTLRHLVNNTDVFFVSFGYGLEFISEFHKYVSISKKNIFSLTREMQHPRSVHNGNTRTKRELNLNSFLASIDVFRSTDQINSSHIDIYERDEAQQFLQHVNRVMES